ncbi:MAG: Rieske 2Fe-2S domain-containing protein, partial [Gammaproteobacteria bacterium]|nr:Rieske 2Fe-2S domain-containing protein [Gammaproteobacteria bacterium]
MFLHNYWYVASWARDLGREPLARIMLNEPVVLFRKRDGTPVALEDRCIHRRLPLSMGRLIGDEIQCHYHGLVFDGTGACVKIPGQERIPSTVRVKSYPVVERNQCIFVWMGDPDAPDASRIPTHFSVLDNEGWTTSLVDRPVRCHYELINDNLLDLSHLATVHASTVGTVHVADVADVVAERDGDHVKVSRWTMDVPAATTYQQFGHYDGNIDRWQVSEFFPPAYFRINNG